MNHKKIVFACGGTGGHIYPALAIADSFKKMGHEILFIGTKERIESKIIPENNYQFISITVQALQRSLTIKNLMFPFRLLKGLYQSRKILKKFKADLVIGTGGYVCGPVLYMASFMGIPTAIQEQNSYPGITTKILMKRVNQIHIAYQEAKKRISNPNTFVNGNPLREKLVLSEKTETKNKLFKNNNFTIGVLGGSLGALTINRAILAILNKLKPDINFFWQTGKHSYEEFKECSSDNIIVKAYIDDMKEYYSALDLIICRAGAMSLAEISYLGIPAIIVPYKFASENHQFYNGKVFEVNNAATLILDDEELIEKLEKSILKLRNNKELLSEMSLNMKQLSKLNARDNIVKKMNELLV